MTSKLQIPTRSMSNPPHAKRVQIQFKGVSLTQQSDAPACDINNILKQFEETGQTTHANSQKPTYDYAPEMTLHESLNKTLKQDEIYNQMSPSEKALFNNSIEEFKDSHQNPENHLQTLSKRKQKQLDAIASKQAEKAEELARMASFGTKNEQSE